MSFGIAAAYELRLKFKGKGRRWTEKYFMNSGATNPPNYGPFMLDCEILTKARRLILAKDFAIVDAAMHRLNSTPDRKFVPNSCGSGFALDTEGGGLEACNNVTTCLNVIYETNEGAWASRQLRGLRDGWVTGDILQVTPTIPSAGVGITLADTVAGLTKEVALGNCLHAIREKSKYLYEVDPLTGDYDMATWTTITIPIEDAISHRDTGVGRKFRGRQPKAA